MWDVMGLTPEQIMNTMKVSAEMSTIPGQNALAKAHADYYNALTKDLPGKSDLAREKQESLIDYKSRMASVAESRADIANRMADIAMARVDLKNATSDLDRQAKEQRIDKMVGDLQLAQNKFAFDQTKSSYSVDQLIASKKSIIEGWAGKPGINESIDGFRQSLHKIAINPADPDQAKAKHDLDWVDSIDNEIQQRNTRQIQEGRGVIVSQGASKDATAKQIREAYRAKKITREEAIRQLEALGMK